MLAGNWTDYAINVGLAGMAAICMFWGFTLIVLESGSRRTLLRSSCLLGLSLILSAAYVAILAVSTGAMAEYRINALFTVGRIALLTDVGIKGALTARFLWRRRSIGVHDFMNHWGD